MMTRPSRPQVNRDARIAAMLCFVTMLVHTIVGTPSLANPVMDSSLEPTVRYTMLFCWHMVTILLGAMGLAYAHAAVRQNLALLFSLTLLSVAFMVLNLVIGIASGLPVSELPQWTLFLAIAIFGGRAILVERRFALETLWAESPRSAQAPASHAGTTSPTAASPVSGSAPKVA